ncbi:putative PurR-regulated permease PerM [Limimaricola soesokkakensis]|uniref:AI-2 transport protein TqsA n=1 Tax=Limimaricola soesokkakensis TaxID=1343159 RepID=A0A1X6Z724_9RHOB|nr:AI-2E family transporter [Limimaricola soesokkakensis]PSK86722.1 putative PurR-regulated permease PerM [Limimaricola soesokkakensis]SLN42129.1 AI-2 transport protein TqsA [Limimaricola soesokkakensis]
MATSETGDRLPDTATEADLPDPALELAENRLSELRKIRRLMLCSFLLAAFTATYFARDVLLPIVLAILLTLTLRPLVRGLQRIGIPPGFSAVLLMLAIGLGFAIAGYFLSGPIGEMAARAPQIGSEVQSKLAGLMDRFASIQEVGKQVTEMADAAGATDGEEKVEVVVDQSGLIPEAVGSVASITSSLVAAMILTLFLLASGDFYHRRIVEASPKLHDKKRALTIVRDVEKQISRYLAAITMINAGLGLAIGVALWILGLPMPHVWGTLAFLLNFMPFIGAIIGTAAVGAFALVSFDSVPYALLAPLSYFALTTIEGNFVTPMLVGRRLELNIVSVFVTVAFWIWLWGVPGAVLAVPFLVVVKAICDNVPSLKAFGSFLSGDPAMRTDDQAAENGHRPEKRSTRPA